MSNKISRRTFLKCTGASAAALGAAAMLGGCGSSTSDAIEVKVGDKVSNWNNLGVQLTSVFTMSTTPDLPDHEYVAVLITAVNRSGATTFNIGAQNLAELDAAYPLDNEATKIDVAKAVEELFGVKVAKVNTISVRGRYRRQGMHAGYTAKSKKAIVTLTPDSKEIEFFNSMV